MSLPLKKCHNAQQSRVFAKTVREKNCTHRCGLLQNQVAYEKNQQETGHSCGWHGCEQGKVTPDTEHIKLNIFPGADALKKENATKGEVCPFGGIRDTSGWRIQ